MKYEIQIYDEKYQVDIDESKKELIVERILKYCEDNNCVFAEALHQDDECLLDAPNVLSDIIGNILEFKIRED